MSKAVAMRVELENNYFVEIDPLNHTLKFRGEPKLKPDGTLSRGDDRRVGYYKNMRECLNSAIRDSLASSNKVTNFCGWLEEVEKFKSIFN
ncbi:MAG: hypothetical protein V3R67_08865 [Thermodesulfobacteriota bacterium]